MVEPGSASLGVVALGTSVVVVPPVSTIAVGEVVPYRIAVVRRVCVA